MNGLAIIPECYVDTCLTETITGCYNKFNHQKGCNTVVRKMKETFGNRFAVGIIDKDKREVPYMQEFELVASNESLFLHKHKTKHHYIIQISPAIECFFLKAAKEKGVNITEYGFPADLKALTKKTKQISSKDELVFKEFKRLFKDISETSELQRLATLIQYLGKEEYNVNPETAKKILEG